MSKTTVTTIPSFITNLSHRRIISDVLAECAEDQDCVGVLLEGSLARGDAYPDSDVDLRLLLADGAQRRFRSEVIGGIHLEIRYGDFDHARIRLANDPMDVCGYLDGRILHDPAGRLAELVGIARDTYSSYRTTLEEKRRLYYWLRSTQEKVRGALTAGDTRKAALVATTSTWQLLEALWAINSSA